MSLVRIWARCAVPQLRKSVHTYGWQAPPARWQVFADRVAGFLRAGGWIAPIFTKQVAFPIFVLRELGVTDLIITNACGGIREDFRPGDLMLITDHINLLGNNPLIGPNDERFGSRFPDMSEVYDRGLLHYAEAVAGDLSLPVQKGVYALFSGPCYETAAEIRAYRALGADAIGMSTVPEATAANYLGMRVLGISCITNMATGLSKTAHSHEEVLAIARKSGERFGALLRGLLKNWPA